MPPPYNGKNVCYALLATEHASTKMLSCPVYNYTIGHMHINRINTNTELTKYPDTHPNEHVTIYES